MEQDSTTKSTEGGSNENADKPKGLTSYLKTLGIAGFLFFLVKGLIWLAIFWGIGKSC